MTPEDFAVFRGDRWFAMAPADARDRLFASARVVSVAAGAVLYEVGDAPDGLRGVLQGEVRLVTYPADGVEAFVSILGPGAWFGELSTLDGGPRPHDAVASVPSRILHIPATAFDAAVEAEPRLYRALALLVCARQRASLMFMAQSLAQPLLVRLARTIDGAAGRSKQLRIRQEDLAAMLGVSRQTINRALKALQAEGLIAVSYQLVTVLDWPGLKRRGDPARG